METQPKASDTKIKEEEPDALDYEWWKKKYNLKEAVVKCVRVIWPQHQEKTNQNKALLCKIQL